MQNTQASQILETESSPVIAQGLKSELGFDGLRAKEMGEVLSEVMKIFQNYIDGCTTLWSIIKAIRLYTSMNQSLNSLIISQYSSYQKKCCYLFSHEENIVFRCNKGWKVQCCSVFEELWIQRKSILFKNAICKDIDGLRDCNIE